MRFTIKAHMGSRHAQRPPDAIELLWQRLSTIRDEVSFTKVGSEIRATWGADADSALGRQERAEIGRRAVLEIVSEVCERAAELQLEWFAVIPAE